MKPMLSILAALLLAGTVAAGILPSATPLLLGAAALGAAGAALLAIGAHRPAPVPLAARPTAGRAHRAYSSRHREDRS